MAELEFRTGKRAVPDHLADLMAGIETYKLTYEEALRQANARLTGDYLRKAQDRMLHEHFRRGA